MFIIFGAGFFDRIYHLEDIITQNYLFNSAMYIVGWVSLIKGHNKASALYFFLFIRWLYFWKLSRKDQKLLFLPTYKLGRKKEI